MREEASNIAVGVMMLLFGLLGLFMASRAMDDEIYVFGLSLVGFAVLFIFGLIRRHFDEVDASLAREADHG